MSSSPFNYPPSLNSEIQEVLTRHFQSQLDEESERLWDSGILDQQRLDEIRKEDLHAKH